MSDAIVKLEAVFEGKVPRVTYKGQRATLAVLFGAFLGYSHNGSKLTELITTEWFKDFIEGVHYVWLIGKNLKDFKAKAELSPWYGDTLKFAPKLMLLLEPGITSVLLITNHPAGTKLRQFLGIEVIPELEKKGSYSLNKSSEEDLLALEHKRTTMLKMQLDIVSQARLLLSTTGGIDSKDEFLIRDRCSSILRRMPGASALPTDQKLLPAAEPLTVVEICAEAGYTVPHKKNALSLIGKGAMARFIGTYGEGSKPPYIMQRIHGRPTQVAAYLPNDHWMVEESLKDFLAKYPLDSGQLPLFEA